MSVRTTVTTGELDGLRVVHRKYYARLTAAVIVVVVAVLVLWSAARNSRFEWGVVGQYIFSSRIIDGLGTTLFLTLIAAIVASVLGLILAMMTMSDNRVLRSVSGVYIWFFRGTPALVQLLFWYNFAALYPTLGIGLPGQGFLVELGSYNSMVGPMGAAILGLGLNQAAYMSEIIRGGLLSVGRGQHEASAALGLSPSVTLRLVTFPQAMRAMAPPAMNQFIGLLKETSLVSVISVAEMLFVAQSISATTLQTIPLLVVASLWYLVAVTVLTYAEMLIERRASRGFGARHA